MTFNALPPIDPVAYIRQYVPVAYGLLLTWLTTRIPPVGEFIAFLKANFGLSDEFVVLVLSFFVVAGFYWVARKLGQRWPAVEKYLLGSSQVPIYVEQNKPAAATYSPAADQVYEPDYEPKHAA